MKFYIAMTNALKDVQRGAAMPEYGLLVALIAIAAIIAVTAVGTSLDGLFTEVSTELDKR